MKDIGIILQEMSAVLHREELQIDAIATILQGKRVFVVGEGRSGLMGKSFAMRLMHLGANLYVIGETITPAIDGEDVLVAVSGSGTTESVLMVARKAKKLGCTVIAVTTDPISELANLSTQLIHVPAATKYRKANESPSVQPLGSLFDQCAHVVFDAICLQYANLQDESNQSAYKRHSNLE